MEVEPILSTMLGVGTLAFIPALRAQKEKRLLLWAALACAATSVLLGQISSRAASQYRAGPYRGRITLVRTEEFHDNVEIARWYGVDSGGVDVCTVPGSHRSMLREPDVASLAAALEDCIDAASSSDRSPGGMAPAAVEAPPA